MLDTAIAEETPEGIEVTLLPAGVWARGLAFLFDEALRWLLILGGFFIGQYAGVFGYGVGLLVWFSVYWFYGVLFEVLNNGQTPGKRLRQLQVVHQDGTPIRLPASLLRNLLLWVDALPGVYLAGIISMCLSPRFQRLGDLVAGTMVVYRQGADPAVGEGRSSRPSVVDDALPALSSQLTREDRAVLVDFAERCDSLSPARRQELAGLLAPVLGVDPSRAEARILRLAEEVTGGRPAEVPGS